MNAILRVARKISACNCIMYKYHNVFSEWDLMQLLSRQQMWYRYNCAAVDVAVAVFLPAEQVMSLLTSHARLSCFMLKKLLAGFFQDLIKCDDSTSKTVMQFYILCLCTHGARLIPLWQNHQNRTPLFIIYGHRSNFSPMLACGN